MNIKVGRQTEGAVSVNRMNHERQVRQVWYPPTTGLGEGQLVGPCTDEVDELDELEEEEGGEGVGSGKLSTVVEKKLGSIT